MNKIIDSAVILALMTAILYCVSTAYYDGYLTVMELQHDILDRNLHQILYHSLLVSVVPVMTVLFVLVFVSVLFSYVAVPMWISFLRTSFSNKKLVLKGKKRFFKNRTDAQFEMVIKRHTRRFFTLFIIAVLSLFYLAYVESLGIKHAEAIQDEIRNGDIQKSNIVNVKIDGVGRELYWLACGSRNCAGIELETKKVFYFEQKSISFGSTKI